MAAFVVRVLAKSYLNVVCDVDRPSESVNNSLLPSSSVSESYYRQRYLLCVLQYGCVLERCQRFVKILYIKRADSMSFDLEILLHKLNYFFIAEMKTFSCS